MMPPKRRSISTEVFSRMPANLEPIGRLVTAMMLFSMVLGLAGCNRGEAVPAPGETGDAEDVASEVEEAPAENGLAPSAVDVPDFIENPVIDGLPMGFTEAGHPYRGSPDAPLTFEEFSDYHCPFCARFASETLPELLETYGAEGQVRFVFREFPIIALHPQAELPSRAALCVAEQGIEPFWKVHDALFADQSAWSRVQDPDAYLAALAEAAGVDRTTYQECYDSGRVDEIVQAGVAEARTLGFDGTPSFQVGRADTGEAFPLVGAQPLETFQSWFDALLAGEDPPIPPTPAPPELPAWANAEGLAPDANQPGLNMAGDPHLGQTGLEVNIVEFTDYQCEPCQEFERGVFPAVKERLIDTGRVGWVVKHLPLPEHPQSTVAAAAAQCAAEQGRFWDMHAAIYESVARWAVAEPDPVLVEVAVEQGLEEAEFAACLAGRAALERVMEDMQHAKDVTQTTPAFVVLMRGEGQVLRGNRSADAFLDTIEGVIGGEN